MESIASVRDLKKLKVLPVSFVANYHSSCVTLILGLMSSKISS